MPGGLRARLAALMFLTYAVYGLWAVTLGAFLMGAPHEGGLNMPAGHVAAIYATLAVGATVSPLVVGLVADRLFPIQRVLAVLHLAGAGLLAAMLWVCLWSAAEVQGALQLAAKDERVAVNLRDGSTIQLSPIAALEWEKQLRFSVLAPDDQTMQLEQARQASRRRQLLRTIGLGQFVPKEVLYIIEPRRGWVTKEDILSDAEILRKAGQNGLNSLRSHAEVTAAADRAFPPLFALMLAYACVYLPTTGLANVVAFRNLPDPGRQYGPFRAVGTLGWIAAGLFVGFAAPPVSPLPFLYAAVASAVLAGLCLLLPHTPPVKLAPCESRGAKWIADALGLPALRMLADRSFLVYVLAALAATALMPFHNSYANKFLVDLGVPHPAATQTLAQPTEILGTLLIPWVWARLGTKGMLCVGLLASAARFALYATASVPAVVGLGLPLHGVGFSLFYIAAALYVDRQAPPDLRASAQGLVTVVTLGLGGVVGNWFAGRVVEFHTAGGVVDWRPVWLVPALGTLAAALFFALAFRECRVAAPERCCEASLNSSA